MPNRLKKFLWVLFALFGAPVTLFLFLLFLTVGDYSVPATVRDDPELARLPFNQALFHIQTFGAPENPPLFVLHDGPGGDFRNLLPLQALADRFHIIFYDQRGAGLSQRVKAESLTLEQYLKDLEAIIAHYAAQQKIVLLGHGWGGMLATRYTGQNPQKVADLILLEPGFLNAEAAYEILPEMSKVTDGKMLQLVMTWIKSFHLKAVDADAGSDFILAEIRNSPAYYCPESKMDWPHWRGGFGAWKMLTESTMNSEGKLEVEFAKGIEAYNQPVLILTGVCNRLTGPDFQQKQARLFQHAKVEILQDTGHMMTTEKPKETLALIRSFLNKQEPN